MLHNGVKQELDARMILLDKWKLPEIIGEEKVSKPSLMLFNNEIEALRLLEKHIKDKSDIAIHFDVDFDGIASGYLMYNEMHRRGITHLLMIINKDKEHGIKDKHADFINNNRSCQLLIIVDSSSNDIETIKKFNCDVIVIDHHDVNNNIDKGYCNDGEHVFIVVNSTIEAFDFEINKELLINSNFDTFKDVEKCYGTQKMSCGTLVYEILRMWYTINGQGDSINKSRKYQWAAASLFTDQINLIDSRNQWYIQNMCNDRTIDESLLKIAEAIGKFNPTLDKSFIQFKLAPLINKAIRANAGSEVLSRIIHNTSTVGELVKYNKIQEEAIGKILRNTLIEDKSYIMINTTNLGISRTYNGVIASKLCGDKKRNTVVYKFEDGIYRGSFRGVSRYNYKDECFKLNGLIAEGHPSAFGFIANSEKDIEKAMISCANKQPLDKHASHFISLGNVDDDMRCEYHIETLEELRKSRLLLMLAYGNGNVGSEDEINMLATTYDVRLLKAESKYYKYLLLDDLELISFEALQGKYFSIYAEYSNEIKLYARNL